MHIWNLKRIYLIINWTIKTCAPYRDKSNIVGGGGVYLIL